MSPYKIEMYVNSYAEDKEPLYKVMIYDRNGKNNFIDFWN